VGGYLYHYLKAERPEKEGVLHCRRFYKCKTFGCSGLLFRGGMLDGVVGGWLVVFFEEREKGVRMFWGYGV